MNCITLSNLIGIIQIIITAIVGLFTILVYFRITRLANDNNNEQTDRSHRNNLFNKLNMDLDRIVDYTIRYPYFDDAEYKKNYTADLTGGDGKLKENVLRYEAFAIMNFNFIEDLNSFFDGKEDQMTDMCNFEELIIDHQIYWENMKRRGEKGYAKIYDLVEKVIAEAKRAENQK
jgi:hypothetical protein